MPTRAEAVATLYELIDSGVLSEDLTSALELIARCIEEEDAETHLGVFLWGAKDDDWVELFVAHREDLWTDELEAKVQAIYDKYKI